MKWLLALFLVLLSSVAFAQLTQSASYTIGKFHLGSAGNVGASATFDIRSTTTYEQGSNPTGTSATFLANSGWYDLLKNVSIIVNKTDTPDPIGATGILNYTINVTNIGPGTAFNVIVTDTFPSEVSFVNASPTPTSGNNVFNLGNLAENESRSINITTQVANNIFNTIVINNSVNVSFISSTGLLRTAFATENTTVTAAEPNVSVIKNDTIDPVNVSQNITYEIIVNNSGPGNASNVTIVDILPAEVSFINASPQPDTGTNTTFTIGNLGANNSASVNITVVVSNSTADLTIITNQVNVSFRNSTGANLSTSTNETTTIRNPSATNVTVAKSDSTDPVTPGSTFTYAITVTAAQGTAENVVVNDSLPTTVSFVSSAPAIDAGSNLSFSVGNITQGDSVIINITAQLLSNATGGSVFTNVVNVSFTNFSGSILNVSTTESTTVATAATTTPSVPGRTGGSAGRSFTPSVINPPSVVQEEQVAVEIEERAEKSEQVKVKEPTYESPDVTANVVAETADPDRPRSAVVRVVKKAAAPVLIFVLASALVVLGLFAFILMKPRRPRKKPSKQSKNDLDALHRMGFKIKGHTPAPVEKKKVVKKEKTSDVDKLKKMGFKVKGVQKHKPKSEKTHVRVARAYQKEEPKVKHELKKIASSPEHKEVEQVVQKLFKPKKVKIEAKKPAKYKKGEMLRKLKEVYNG